MTKHSENENSYYMHFYCDKRKQGKKWIFLFHRQITLYWRRHKYRFQLSLVKKNKNKNFKTLISFCCQTLFLIYSQHFIKKIVFSRFGHGLYVRETGAWRGWATQFFNWLLKFRTLFFSDGSKRYQTWLEWCSNSNCLFQKKHKNCPAAWGSTARPRLWCAWIKPLCLARRHSFHDTKNRIPEYKFVKKF